MVVIARHRLQPLAREAGHVLVVEYLRVGHLARNQEAHAVRPIKEAWVLDLLVLAGAVEAHLFGETDIVLDGFVGGRREDALGPIALVEHEFEIHGPAVKQNAALFGGDGAEAEI